ncbi:MAG: amidophosphoribosyltransferase [Oscillospiraceae bacterium]|nr:amidophosphoribosyltransferase [Oscillospiraceae bacterium]
MKHIHEECGVFGIWSPEEYDVASEAYMALYALQHRGQESCGIAVNKNGVITAHKDVGLVPDVFHRDVLNKLGDGQMAVGHVRYSTSGKPTRSDAQPLVVRHIKGNMVLAHNGALTNARELREELELSGAIFHTNNDSEVISYIITSERLRRSSIEQAIEGAMYRLKGAYSLVIMSPRKLIAVRDPNGFRPLCMGRMGDKIIFASESCALDSIGASFVRDIEPGEIVVCDRGEIRSIRSHCSGKCNMCVFEYVYNARPDSVIEGVSVHEARLKAGAILAQEHPVEADVVIGVPDSGLDAALGYSRESGIPYGVGFIKNRYIGRTFIQPTQSQREKSVRIKLNALAHTVEGKRVILVDDSIVRGTTSARIVSLLREAGAKEVHMRLSSPPFIDVCYFGTDVSSKKNLIACQMSQEEIRKHIGADSLGYLSVEGIKKVAERPNCDYCVGCFTGEYPVPVPGEHGPSKFDKAISNEEKNNK